VTRILNALPTQPPGQGFVWIACARTAFGEQLREEVQASLQATDGTARWWTCMSPIC
jgi:magnesium transporter